MELQPPDDPTIATLWLGNVEADISEGDLREVIYPYGHIQNIHLVRSAKCAFVEFASREMAENAAKELYRAMIVKDKVINVNWSKPRSQGLVEGGRSSQSGSNDDGPTAMLPPPGMEKAPTSAYLLPGMAMPFMPPPPMGMPPGISSCPGPSSGNYFIPNLTPQAPLQLSHGVGDMSSLGAKRSAGDMLIASGLDGDSSEEQRRTQPRPPPRAPTNLYPSMNPSRMGAKI